MQSSRILAGLTALLFCTTTVRADAVYPSVNTTASWSYSSPEGSHHGSISSGATQRSHNWGNEAAFNITSPPPPGQYFPLMADFVYGQRAHPYLLTPPSQAHTGQYVAFDSLISSEWSDDPSRIFQWKISGTFNAQSENGQHYLFQAQPPAESEHNFHPGSSMEIIFNVDNTLAKQVTYSHGAGAPGIGWGPLTWDSTSDHAGQTWELIFTTTGQTGAYGILGGIGTYMPQSDGTPIPGPGIAMACAVGLAGIKRRRRR